MRSGWVIHHLVYGPIFPLSITSALTKTDAHCKIGCNCTSLSFFLEDPKARIRQHFKPKKKKTEETLFPLLWSSNKPSHLPLLSQDALLPVHLKHINKASPPPFLFFLSSFLQKKSPSPFLRIVNSMCLHHHPVEKIWYCKLTWPFCGPVKERPRTVINTLLNRNLISFSLGYILQNKFKWTKQVHRLNGIGLLSRCLTRPRPKPTFMQWFKVINNDKYLSMILEIQ